MFVAPLKVFFPALLVCLLLTSCGGEENGPYYFPQVTIVNPTPTSEIFDSTEILVSVVSVEDIKEVILNIGGGIMKTWTAPPYNYIWDISRFKDTIRNFIVVTAHAVDGGTGSSRIDVVINKANPPTELEAFDAKDRRVQLQWKDNSRVEEGYMIEMKQGSSGFVIFDSTGINENKFIYSPADSTNINEYKISLFKKGKLLESTGITSVKYFRAFEKHSFETDILDAMENIRRVLFTNKVYNVSRKVTEFILTNHVKFSPDLVHFIQVDPTARAFRLMNMDTYDLQITPQIHNSAILDFEFNSRGDKLASFDSSKVLIWNVTGMNIEDDLNIKINRLKFIDNDRQIALFHESGEKIYLYNVDGRMVTDSIVTPDPDEFDLIEILNDGSAYYLDDTGKHIIKVIRRSGGAVIGTMVYNGPEPVVLSNTSRYALLNSGTGGQYQLLSSDFSQLYANLTGLTNPRFGHKDTFIMSGRELIFLEGKWIGQ
ncbi:MAG: hypothetical protein HUU54_01925 [Ignavibacteriaceae bacterium]|nr:hypothetical protein [Ignavibacteriaceae bacterium]